MVTKEILQKTNFKMSLDEYQRCDCASCGRQNCVHKNAYRRFPKIDGGLGLCYNLDAFYKAHIYKKLDENRIIFDQCLYFSTKYELDAFFAEWSILYKKQPYPTAWEFAGQDGWQRLAGY